IRRGASRWCSRDDNQRGARFRARLNRATTLYAVGPRTGTTMQSCASAAKLRSGGPILPIGMKAKGLVGNPPPRTVIGIPSQAYRTGPKLSGYPQRPPIIVPDAKRRRPVQRPATRTATERSVACVPRPRSWACEHRERSPCELDTTALRRSPSGTLEIATPIAPCLAELDHCRNGLTLSPGVFCRSRRRASEAGITSYGRSVVHISRQHLVHQHVGRLNADPNHTRQQAHHGVWSIIGRLLKMLQACLLDLPNLIADKPSALHVAPQLSQRVRRDRLALRRSQTVKAPDGPFQFGIESADAQPNQRCLHSVDNPTLLADEALALAARALGILVL